MSNDVEIPASVWFQMLANQMGEERFVEGVKEYIRLYYKRNDDLARIEPHILEALETLFMAATVSADLEDLVRDVEKEINERGGVWSDWEQRYVFARTYED